MAANTRPTDLGSLTLVAGSLGAAAPAGTTHFVDGWEPLCGSDRVRFVFPGRGEHLGASCPDCVQAVTVPRPRAAKTAASTRATVARTAARTGTTRARRAS